MPVTDGLARGGRRPVGVVAAQPHVHVEQVALLGPQEARKRLALDAALVLALAGPVDALVKLVGLGLTLVQDRLGVGQRGRERLVGQPQPDGRRLAGVDRREDVVQGRLGADALGVEARLLVDDPAVEGVLDVGRATGLAGAEDAGGIGVVVGEQ